MGTNEKTNAAPASDELLVALPPEILAMMAASDASLAQSEAQDAAAQADLETSADDEAPVLSMLAAENAADGDDAEGLAAHAPGLEPADAELSLDEASEMASDDALPAFALAMLAEAGAPVEGETTLALPAVLDITAAAGLHGSLLAHRGAPLALDAGEVKRLGGQCLQLLVSAGRTWGADGVPIRLGARSEAFERDLALMGLTCDELFQKEAA